MDEATQWMRVLGAVLLLAPFVLSRVPALRAHARSVGLVALVLYIGFGAGFVVWYTLIRQG